MGRGSFAPTICVAVAQKKETVAHDLPHDPRRLQLMQMIRMHRGSCYVSGKQSSASNDSKSTRVSDTLVRSHHCCADLQRDVARRAQNSRRQIKYSSENCAVDAKCVVQPELRPKPGLGSAKAEPRLHDRFGGGCSIGLAEAKSS